MLRTLSIHDFVIVDSLELEFTPGFSALTGETGAGKSILIDALTLTLGGRSDADMVREGTNRADISAEFSTDEQVNEWLHVNEMTSDDDSVLLRRVVDASGRSRGFINGIAATTAQMRELGEMLIDIHGQHAHQSLMKMNRQRELLDGHAGLQSDLADVARLYREWQTLVVQCREFENNAKSLLLERERLEWQVQELEKLTPKPGEWGEVSNEHSRLSHAASLIGGAQEAITEISESDHPILSRLNTLQQKLSRLSDIDVSLQPINELLDSARIQLQEVVYGLNDYLGRVDLDPERLQHIETRMEALHSAARKFKVMPEDLPNEFDTLRNQLAQLVGVSDVAVLQEQEAAAKESYIKAAKILSAKRRVAAQALGTAVTEAIQELSMVGGQFSVLLNPCEPGPYGLEQVEFMVGSHSGTALRSLAKVASGGELARISLAISVVTSSATTIPTLIFDEVDSGIGGAVAEVVGRFLKKLGNAHQVLCVTHLPQVASQANQHFQVSKILSDQAAYPVSRISMLSAEERVEEIARMLGGVEITSTTRKHAREMLIG